MIRTHRPRGYQWTCASAFQQTKLFRNIRYEITTEEDDDILVSDSEDEWPLSERAAKRRRVEKLADDFLNGLGLEITSARLDPQATRHAISYSFARPRHAARALAEAHVEPNADVWEDVLDHGEILRGVRDTSVDVDQVSEMPLATQEIIAMEDEMSVSEDHAQSSCHRRRSTRLIKLALGPSDEALRKAAELRNRRLRQPVPEIAESQPQSCSRRLVEETQQTLTSTESTDSATHDTTSFSDCGPSPTAAWTSSKWLRTGAFKPKPKQKGVDEDCSKDELGWSSFSIPSQAARVRETTRSNAERVAGSQPSFGAEPRGSCSTGQCSSFASSKKLGNQADHVALSAITEGETGQSSESGHGFETAPEPQEDDRAVESQLQGESQTQLFIREGIIAKPRSSWASMNEVLAVARSPSPRPNESASGRTESVQPEIRSSVRESARHAAVTKVKGRSTKSAGNSPSIANQQPRRSNRRRSAPSESQKVTQEASEPQLKQHKGPRSLRVQGYTESVGGKDSSPFVFRKRVFKPAGSEKTVREPVEPSEEKSAPQSPAVTPRKVMQFPSDGCPQTRYDPRTPLVDEHLNSVLPGTGGGSVKPSTSLRRSLREEMIAQGAELSRIPSEVSSQSQSTGLQQPQVTSCEDTNDENAPSPHVERAPETQHAWPGTQALLDQAHNDLFTSPHKDDSALYLGEKSTPGAVPTTTKKGRRPLQTLSQERMPMPSTQVLIDNWNGWSSIKKRRSSGKRPSLDALQSPSIVKSGIATMIGSDPVDLHTETVRRQSYLRHSLILDDSPMRDQAAKTSSMPERSTDRVPETEGRVQSGHWHAPQPSGKTASSATFSFAGDLSSFRLSTTSKGSQEHNTRTVLSQNDAADVSLSFGPPVPPSTESATLSVRKEATVSQPARTLSSSQDFDSLMPSGWKQNAQEPNPRNPEFDTQELHRTVTELERDVLGTANDVLRSMTDLTF